MKQKSGPNKAPAEHGLIAPPSFARPSRRHQRARRARPACCQIGSDGPQGIAALAPAQPFSDLHHLRIDLGMALAALALARPRSRAALSLATRRAFSYSANDPAIWRI